MTRTGTMSRSAEVMQNALHAREINGLDALRALAIVMVVFYHNGAPVSGTFAVNLFFVLSGFLITRILLREFHKSGSISLRRFYFRRTLRIFPAFYVCWILTIYLIARSGAPMRWWQISSSFFYLGNYGRAFLNEQQQVLFPMGISWSLAIEEQFYLLWPALLLWLLGRSKEHDEGIRKVTSALLIAIFVVWAYRAFLMTMLAVPETYISNAFEMRADALMVGSLLASATFIKKPATWMMYPLLSRWLLVPTFSLLASFGLRNRTSEAARFFRRQAFL